MRAFPVVLSGRDLIASAQTGTGKTAAFGLPILTKLGSHKPGAKPRCLILEPTRELAAQVETAFRDFSRFNDLLVSVMYGGVGYGKQRDELKKGADTLVATPGRLLDFLEQGDVDLSEIEILVLDEVDRMLDMGFLPQVRRIVERCNPKRQTLFFSATIPPELQSLTQWVVRDPEIIEIGHHQSPAETITHALYPVSRDQKFELLLALLKKIDFTSVLVFCRTKVGADQIAAKLKTNKLSVVALHSNRTQSERMDALTGFKSDKYDIMVATDIAARGIDIAGVSHVINFDVPQHPEDYVHRIGRTGRAEATGEAFTIFTGEDVEHVTKIEYFIGAKIERRKLEGFPYLYCALFADEVPGAPPRPVRRRSSSSRRR
ncbi:MAG: DEAD/DEAH box helicase [Chthoniobacteraceae bacterium]|nr:DEAD/DEAH box helicase [Chthoniobacteraceae bacterium]